MKKTIVKNVFSTGNVDQLREALIFEGGDLLKHLTVAFLESDAYGVACFIHLAFPSLKVIGYGNKTDPRPGGKEEARGRGSHANQQVGVFLKGVIL